MEGTLFGLTEERIAELGMTWGIGGFIALTKIVEADASMPNFTSVIRVALFYILLACIFDLLDGRVARLGGSEKSLRPVPRRRSEGK